MEAQAGRPLTPPPPAFTYKDSDEIYLPAGEREYWAMGGVRHRGQYLEPTTTMWEIAAQTAVDVDGTYSAGVTSGMIGGAKVVSSWYSVFLMGGTGICLVLPLVQVQAISYANPNTTINPGDHNTGLVATDTFFVANDAWNNYRLLLQKIEDPVNDGLLLTISDTVDGTPDQIIMAGDQTAKIAAKDWLRLVPPSGTDCLYVGTIRIDGSGNSMDSKKDNWKYVFAAISLNGNLATSAGNTYLSAAIPPSAHMIYMSPLSSSGTNPSDYTTAVFYYGVSDSNVMGAVALGQQPAGNYTQAEGMTWFPLSGTALLRNRFTRYNAGTPAAAVTGTLRISVFEE